MYSYDGGVAYTIFYLDREYWICVLNKKGCIVYVIVYRVFRMEMLYLTTKTNSVHTVTYLSNSNELTICRPVIVYYTSASYIACTQVKEILSPRVYIAIVRHV